MEPNTQVKSGNGPSPENAVYVKSYTNRWGQEMRAEDYGLKAFVFYPKRKKSSKTKRS